MLTSSSHVTLPPARSVSQTTLPPAVSVGSPTFGLPSHGHSQAPSRHSSSMTFQQHQQLASSQYPPSSGCHAGPSHVTQPSSQALPLHSQQPMPIHHAATVGAMPDAMFHAAQHPTLSHLSSLPMRSDNCGSSFPGQAHSLPAPPLPAPPSTHRDLHHGSLLDHSQALSMPAPHGPSPLWNHSQQQLQSFHSQRPHTVNNISSGTSTIHGSAHRRPAQTLPPTAGGASASAPVLPSSQREPPNFSNFANDASFHAAYSGPDTNDMGSRYGQRRGDGVEIVDAATYFANPASERAPRSVPRTGLDCVEQPDCVFELLHPELEYGYEMGSALPPRRAERMDDATHAPPAPGYTFQAPARAAAPAAAFGGPWNSDWVTATTRAILMAEAPFRGSNPISSPGPFQFYETTRGPSPDPVAVFR